MGRFASSSSSQINITLCRLINLSPGLTLSFIVLVNLTDYGGVVVNERLLHLQYGVNIMVGVKFHHIEAAVLGREHVGLVKVSQHEGLLSVFPLRVLGC